MSLEPTLRAVRYADLPGWADDNHAAAFKAFLKSAAILLDCADRDARSKAVQHVCRQSLLLSRCKGRISATAARCFFERWFQPHLVMPTAGPGLLTGYYEPVLDGSAKRTARFTVPLYRRPADLETVVDDTLRGAPGVGLTHMRRTADGLIPYFSRAEIDAGALAGKGLELVWLSDPVDAFFMQVQGSGRVRLADGGSIRITYDGKNGHPYTSIGRYLIERGEMAAATMSLQRLGAYLIADAARGRATMQQNASFVFFKALEGEAATAAQGARAIPLTSGRSLAVDASVHALGTPVFVTAPTLTHAGGGRAFRRLMIAQDVGSAIRGPSRGDVFFGSGARAGRLAGITKHRCEFNVLLPRPDAIASSSARKDAGGRP